MDLESVTAIRPAAERQVSSDRQCATNRDTASRDDVLILANDDDWVLFYCHEDELEYGHRIRSTV
jgi:hypothetical protein